MRDVKTEARALVAEMTLEEKVSQMLYNAAPVPRLGIPAYNWWNEALHGVARSGVATVFPQAIGLAATFDPALVERIAEIISEEARAKYHAYQEEGDYDIYKGLTFWSPNINLFRDPRWGRGHETYGEDPYLTARMGVAFIRGLQGDDPEQMKTAACAKHYAVHSGPEGERHTFDVAPNAYDLWNTYLPAFEAAVREGHVEAVMGAYNRVNGEPCCGSHTLLLDILRDKWEFDGHVVSDCGAIMDFHQYHKITDTAVESAAMAVENGCDLNCGATFGYCLQAVRDGLLSEEAIDRAVIRLMTTRLKLGMLGSATATPHRFTTIPYETVDCGAHRAVNIDAAQRSLVLLKNDGVLPLHTHIKTLGVIGPNADSRVALEGNYCGTASEYVTVLTGVRAYAEQHHMRVLYAEGCHIYKDRTTGLAGPNDRLAEAVAVTRRSDAVVLCLGLDATLEGEEGDAHNAFAAGDKTTLALPESQRKLIEKVCAAADGKPVIVVVLSGSALDLSYADNHANAVLQVFYPGAQGGAAVAAALFGTCSPQGKLPVTFYRSDDDLPDFRDYDMTNRTYRYFNGEPLYPFGYGLGYYRFELSEVALSKADGLVHANVANVGLRTGNTTGVVDSEQPIYETVQVYARAEGEREHWNLSGLAKVYLKPGERAKVTIDLHKNTFMRYDESGERRPCNGARTLYVGFSQPDARSIALTGQQPVVLEV